MTFNGQRNHSKLIIPDAILGYRIKSIMSNAHAFRSYFTMCTDFPLYCLDLRSSPYHSTRSLLKRLIRVTQPIHLSRHKTSDIWDVLSDIYIYLYIYIYRLKRLKHRCLMGISLSTIFLCAKIILSLWAPHTGASRRQLTIITVNYGMIFKLTKCGRPIRVKMSIFTSTGRWASSWPWPGTRPSCIRRASLDLSRTCERLPPEADPQPLEHQNRRTKTCSLRQRCGWCCSMRHTIVSKFKLGWTAV